MLQLTWASLFLFLIFFPRATPGTPNPAKDSDNPPSYRTAVIVTVVCVVHGILTAIMSIYFIIARPNMLQSWANGLGIISTILAAIQYFPQIWTTYMLKRVGSLSIPMMCIQTPGSFVWAASLATRLGPEGWSAWGVYVITGFLQGTLLVMGSWYEIQARRNQRKELVGRIETAIQAGEAEREQRVDEQTPLIGQ